jgi:ribosome-associated heat shock protein Hsp15
MEHVPEPSIRLDKWLKIARIFKTRSQAAGACEGRQVKVNGEVAKPAKTIKPGDKLTVRIRTRYRELEIQGISYKSISAKDARELYREERTSTLPEETLELQSLLKKSIKPIPSKYWFQ